MPFARYTEIALVQFLLIEYRGHIQFSTVKVAVLFFIRVLRFVRSVFYRYEINAITIFSRFRHKIRTGRTDLTVPAKRNFLARKTLHVRSYPRTAASLLF